MKEVVDSCTVACLMRLIYFMVPVYLGNLDDEKLGEFTHLHKCRCKLDYMCFRVKCIIMHKVFVFMRYDFGKYCQ